MIPGTEVAKNEGVGLEVAVLQNITTFIKQDDVAYNSSSCDAGRRMRLAAFPGIQFPSFLIIY